MRLQLIAFGLALAAAGCSTEQVPAPQGVEGCLAYACHARVEHIHYGGAPLACTGCHGGNPEATTKEAAHVTTQVSFKPSSPASHILNNPSLDEMAQLPEDVLRFLNPSDYRIVRSTCGSATLGGGGCHARITDESLLSVHASLSGHLSGGAFFSGFPADTFFGLGDLTDPYPAKIDGTLPSLVAFPPEAPAQADALAAAFYPAFTQQCLECHLERNGPADPGNFYPGGCNACHLTTDNDGRTKTADQTQNPDEVAHGARHRFTNLIPDSQCDHCHHAHLDRGMLIQGVRERAEVGGDSAIGGKNVGLPDPPNVVWWPQSNYVRFEGDYTIYGKPYPFYIEDEDSTNAVDETPPDIHHERGMACIDCHAMGESHGPGHISKRLDNEIQVRCQSCHGAPEGVIDVSASTLQRAATRVGAVGDNPPTLSVTDSGLVSQIGKLDGKAHPVTQIAQVLDDHNPPEQLAPVDPAQVCDNRTKGPCFNNKTLLGCGLHAGSAAFRASLLAKFNSIPPAVRAQYFPGLPGGAKLPDDLGSRAGRLECFTCHNAWTANCYGCHMVRDDRQMGRNMRTGQMEPGLVSTYGMSVVADALTLGLNPRGRISPMVGTSIFFTYIDGSGNKVFDAVPLASGAGPAGDGQAHNAVHHHTVRRLPRNCDACHPLDGNVNLDGEQLKRAVGFGTGKFVFVDGTGKRHLLDRIVAIDFDGDGKPDDPLGPLGPHAQSATPLIASTHLPLDPMAPAGVPGPLDLDAINRMLGNAVVPQQR